MMTPGEGWICDHALRLEGGTVISFQRYVRPPGGLAPDCPRSLGALPIASGPGGRYLLPLAADEAFWLGLSLAIPDRRAVLALAVTRTEGEPVDVVTGSPWDRRRPGLIVVPDRRWVDGVSLGDGRKAAFVREAPETDEDGWTGLHIYAARGAGEEGAGISARPATIAFVTYRDYASRTGCAAPAPLDPSAGYGGWRLP
ncbi:hypothetical protein ACUSIJ_21845 [Pseudochelatococcus sp. B33]